MATRTVLRSAMSSVGQYLATQAKPTSVNVTSKLISPSPTRPMFSTLRLAPVLGSVVDSQKPLHSAIASARLNSILALDSSCWSCLSLGFALPL